MSLKRVIISTTDKISYHVNALNEITNTTFGGPNGLGAWTAMTTVAGWASPTATNVTVNGSTARLYEDKTYATNGILVSPGNNTFTAVAKDALNRTAAYTSSVNIFTNNSAYLYDTNGNLLFDGYRGFAYDDENQLISVWLTNVWRSDFAYDGRMRRRMETDCIWSGGKWFTNSQVYFIYDGDLVVQERDANNLPLVTYTRGTDLSGALQDADGIGGLLARTDMGQWITGSIFAHALYHTDGNGNVTCLIYPNQTVAAKYLYDAFGTTLAEYGPLADANAYHFSSKEWNANSGLYYYLYRFYDPGLQRWLNRDPLDELGAINLYSYVENDSINLIDAYGLSPSWGNGDSFKGDPWGHGVNPDGTPRDPHVDRTCKKAPNQRCRYNLDGSPRDKAPPLNKKTWPKFTNAVGKVLRVIGSVGGRLLTMPLLILDPCITNPTMPGCGGDPGCA
jgi:RHS repeat-associated protein